MSDGFRCDSDVFGVKAALRIVPAICIDAIAGLKPANPRSHGSDSAGTVAAEHKWKARAAARGPTIPHVCVPPANARRVDRDEHVARVELRHWKRVDRQHLRSAGMIERGRVHSFRDGMHRQFLSVNAHRQSPFSGGRMKDGSELCRRNQSDSETFPTREVIYFEGANLQSKVCAYRRASSGRSAR